MALYFGVFLSAVRIVFKVNNKDNRMTSINVVLVCFIANFKQMSHTVLVFPLLTLNKEMSVRNDPNKISAYCVCDGEISLQWSRLQIRLTNR